MKEKTRRATLNPSWTPGVQGEDAAIQGAIRFVLIVEKMNQNREKMNRTGKTNKL